ncbi:unnamed protein product [Euphydryas editha]|uniref:CRAL-TRIO domain-containing protein n=1 Tax=Euphydryas editha TaxID=104508 RepID=A0AAU9U396_EUPED|nr:unnamed protein product [Euphydryas editha]
MDFIPKDRILETKPDTLEYIRKQYNLNKPGQMKEAVNILSDWVQKQNHFKKKDFSKHYYESTLIACKGSIERAKSMIDKMCTMRTLLPQFFGNYNLKTDFGNLHKTICVTLLPKQTDDHYRVELIKCNDTDVKSFQFMDYFRSNVILTEYFKVHDYSTRIIIVLDFSGSNIMDYISKLNIVEMKQAMTIYMEGYGMRIKAIHIITTSKLIDTILSIAKKVLNKKVAERVYIRKTIQELYEHIPKHILPREYGGEERPLNELQREWLEALTSEEHVKYMLEINEACTDENYRQKDKFNENFTAMAGTFRLLTID